MDSAPVTLIAHYFPQFHPIAENSLWWGESFTDWTNVRRAQPLFAGHRQPRVPVDQFYYDLSDPSVQRWQVDLAKQYGIGGFCYYHYWFNGKLLLERPAENLLTSDIDFPFCFAWANETWSKRWIGENTVLQRQSYSATKTGWKRHFDYLLPFWRDERHVRIGGTPVFLIYRPEAILPYRDMLSYWRDMAREQGLDGLYLVAMKGHEFVHPSALNCFDAVVNFQPALAYSSMAARKKVALSHAVYRGLRLLPENLLDLAARVRFNISRYRVIDFDEAWHAVLARAEVEATSDDRIIQGGFVDWDNTPRYGSRARIFHGATPEGFQRFLTRLVSIARDGLGPKVIFLNAWNEWAECAYLEPDQDYGYAFLEAVRASLVPSIPPT